MSKPKIGRPAIRPEDKKIPVTVKLPPWLVKFMRESEGSQAKMIEEAMVRAYAIKRPGK